MQSCKSYQEIKTPEDYEYDDLVDACYNELLEEYADEIAEQGLKTVNRIALMQRARQMAKERMNWR